MSDQREKAEKRRLSLTLTRAYVDPLDHLVAEGLYTEPQEAIRAALRFLFRRHELEPFWVPEGPPEEGGEGEEGSDGDVA